MSALGEVPKGAAPQSVLQPLLVVRRNSFSREDAASITQRSDDSINLCVNNSVHQLSPRKSTSFSLPRSPLQVSIKSFNEIPSSLRVTSLIAQESGVLSNSAITQALRSCYSDIHLHHLLDSDLVSHPHASTDAGNEADPLLLESPLREGGDEEEDCGSPVSTTYSSASPNGSEVDGHTDAFEIWLLEAHMVENPARQTRGAPDSVAECQAVVAADSADFTPCILRDSALSIELSKSVQQIEHEIRNAIDSASMQAANDTQRQDIHTEVGGDRICLLSGSMASEPTGYPAAESVEPELLLLMEVLIGDGRTETIEVHVGDQPRHLAEAFAARHGLVAETVPRLAQHIQDQLNSLENEDRAGSAQPPPALHESAFASHDPVRKQAPKARSEEDGDIRYNSADSARQNQFDGFVHPPAAPSHAPHQIRREHEREHSYNHLMEKYGHYTNHSNKVNPAVATKDSRIAMDAAGYRFSEQSRERSDPLTMRNLELSEHARLRFAPRNKVFTSSSKSTKEKDSVYNRLYALAETRERWIRRQQKIKAADEVREQQAMMKLEISSKSRDLIAGRGTGGYAHIGERLYDDALNDLAKKQREREKREIEKAQHVDWTCPKCAFVNSHSDMICKNIVAALPPPPSDGQISRRESASIGMAASVEVHPGAICAMERPRELFRPTLISAPVSVVRAVQHNKLRAPASSQRMRTQQQMENEFQQACPFKPRINQMSEEIMHDKLEQEAKAGGSVTTSATGEVRRKNPHLALYEDAFHARAQREAREEEHLKQFSFKPNIGVNALWSKRSGNEGDLVERLAVSKFQELEQKRHSLHLKYAPDRDPATGREYFKPETGRAPIFNRNERGLPIGEFLYEAHREQEEYLRCLRQQQDKDSKQRSEQRFVSDKSLQALEVRKRKTCARLFEWLCKTQVQPQPASTENIIHESRVFPEAVDVSKLQPEFQRVASIIFEFANHEPFTLAEFEGFMEKLVSEVPGLTYTQVLFLTENLRDGKSARRSVERDEKSQEDPELTFRPAIDKNSDALARKHGRNERPSVFEALNQYYEHYKDRQIQVKKQLEREFERAHPFQPTFYTKDRKAKSTVFYSKLHAHEDAATIGSAAQGPEDAAPSLRTAVPNARPFVRPLGRSPSEQTLRSRSNSATSLKSDDEDAALTSHVLAAMGDGSQSAAASSGPSGGPFSLFFSSSPAPAISSSTLGDSDLKSSHQQ